jgi:ribonuclease Z
MTIRDLIILGTSSQQPTRLRNHGAYLFRWNNEGLLFDPGEGTQRQFIFANVAPTFVTRIFISHFHGDHCLGVGSMLMRLNLDKVTHPIHCYYPASGKKYFDRLRYGTIYHEQITVIEHPVEKAGLVHEDENFRIEADFLDHGIENLGWRVTEPAYRKFDKELLKAHGVEGSNVKLLEKEGSLIIKEKRVTLDDVSALHTGESIAVIIDTRPCQAAQELAFRSRLLLCESTYLTTEHDLAVRNKHMTALEAASFAKAAQAESLILTHFSARYLDSSLFEKEARIIFPNTFIAHDLQRFPFLKQKK